VSIEPGKLEELSLEQRERALAYLLEKLHVFQSSKQQRVLGLSHQLDPAVSLPPIASSPVRHQAREVYGCVTIGSPSRLPCVHKVLLSSNSQALTSPHVSPGRSVCRFDASQQAG
jgi:hypothetical protein